MKGVESMNETVRMWVEVVFNIAYLITIWALVIAMARRSGRLAPQNRRVGRLFLWAFALLGLGDTGHVGFRVVAYAMGGIEKNMGLVGTGMLTTAVTVTVFYVLMVAVWKERFNKSYSFFSWLLFAAAAVRLAILAFPANNWGGAAPPEWSLYRNIPLMVQGVGVLVLMLLDGLKHGDRLMRNVAYAILISYACYTPVILFSGIPLVGMLMIPKTLAYLAIAIMAYRNMFSATALTSGSITRSV